MTNETTKPGAELGQSPAPKNKRRTYTKNRTNTNYQKAEPAKVTEEAPKETQPPKEGQTAAPPKKRTYRKPYSQNRTQPALKQNNNIKVTEPAIVVSEELEEEKPKKRGQKAQRKTPVRIIPLGGLNEIGKNMTCYECGQDMFIVDCGLAFPSSDMFGVDLVIPDFSYIEKNFENLRGIVLTHGHEDHIGALPFFLKKFNVPLYGTALTLGLVEGKLKEHGLLGKVTLNVIKPRQTIKMGCMAVEFIRVNHSIPDAVAFAIHTPAGIIIQTGDFKVDYSPIAGEVIDIPRFAQLGNRGVL
ncbi:MAG: Ribonuclease, partial [Oscillospiraceae bacterium]|nr:Ribonuclease [Oscillospiraceae bacterium]